MEEVDDLIDEDAAEELEYDEVEVVPGNYMDLVWLDIIS